MCDLGQGWDGPTEGLRGAASMLCLGLWGKHCSLGHLRLGKEKQKAQISAAVGMLGFVTVPSPLSWPEVFRAQRSVQVELFMCLQEFGSVSGGEKENALGLWWESEREVCVCETEREREGVRMCLNAELSNCKNDATCCLLLTAQCSAFPCKPCTLWLSAAVCTFCFV